MLTLSFEELSTGPDSMPSVYTHNLILQPLQAGGQAPSGDGFLRAVDALSLTGKEVKTELEGIRVVSPEGQEPVSCGLEEGEGRVDKLKNHEISSQDRKREVEQDTRQGMKEGGMS